jgi:hypothetical protein
MKKPTDLVVVRFFAAIPAGLSMIVAGLCAVVITLDWVDLGGFLGLASRCLVCLFLRHGSSIQMICRSSLGIEKKVPNVYLNLGLAPVSTQCSPIGTPYSLLEACGGLNRHSQIVAGCTDSTLGSTVAESLGDRAKSGYSGDHHGGVFG